MFGHVRRIFAVTPGMFIAFALSGCTDDVGDEQKLSMDDVATTTQAVENGELDPFMGEGVIQLYIWNGSNWGYCSGQVIARDTVLTAGHCFWNNGFHATDQDVYVAIYDDADANLTPDGSNPWVLAEVFMRQAFIDGRNAGNATRGEDVAVVRTPNNMSNVSSSDAAALARYTSERPDWLFLFGYGYYTDTNWDKQLRSGAMDDPTWSTANKTITTDYGTSDPHACMYDSGGPYKHQTFEFMSFSGVQFAVQSGAGGSAYCYEDQAVGAMVAYHDTWIEDLVNDGAGACSYETYTMFLDGWNYGTIHALLCW